MYPQDGNYQTIEWNEKLSLKQTNTSERQEISEERSKARRKWANRKQESANSPQMKSLLILKVELLLELQV